MNPQAKVLRGKSFELKEPELGLMSACIPEIKAESYGQEGAVIGLLRHWL